MTQDKARKFAIRQRMAETGEPYSVARHAVEDEHVSSAGPLESPAGTWPTSTKTARPAGTTAPPGPHILRGPRRLRGPRVRPASTTTARRAKTTGRSSAQTRSSGCKTGSTSSSSASHPREIKLAA
jgi:hypothetical protein